MNRYTFGPINSRRFGISLGIDLSPDAKSCNFDCLYCELKGAKPTDKIINPPIVDDIIKEVEEALKKDQEIDVITITSNGEPTLYDKLDILVDELNKIKKDKKLLILSNSSTICNKDIQKTLKKIDLVKLSLDCATQRCFKKIDRPLKGINIENIIKCIHNFRETFTNQLIIEILLVKGINDNLKELSAIADIVKNIRPDRVDIGTIDRPPAYNVKAVDEKDIIELSKIFKDIPLSIIYKNPPKIKKEFNESEILSILSHRPQSQFDIDTFFSDNSKKRLKKLIENKKVKKITAGGVVFYRA